MQRKDIFMLTLLGSVGAAVALVRTKKPEIAGVKVTTLRSINHIVMFGSVAAYIMLSLKKSSK